MTNVLISAAGLCGATIIGAILGFFIKNLPHKWNDIMLGFAGGAMLYVTSDEMIPETHAHGYQKQATYALLLGFMTFILSEAVFK